MNLKDKLKAIAEDKRAVGMIAVLAVAIVLIVVFVGSSKDAKVPEADSENSETMEEVLPEEEVDENPLEIDAYEEINTLVFKYLYGLAEGDIDMVRAVVDVLTDEEIETIEKKKDYIEAYHNQTCYTKKGLEEGSYVVFVAYDMRIYNIDTPAPGIMPLYIYREESGSLCIFNGEATEELSSYVLALAAEEEVAAVIEDIENRYQQLLAEDEEHARFAEMMLKSREEADAEGEADQTEEESEENDTEENTSDENDADEDVSAEVNQQMQFRETVRIRADRTTESEQIGTGYSNEFLTLIESYEDGWSKIEYKGTVGYCKTEFLQEPQ